MAQIVALAATFPSEDFASRKLPLITLEFTPMLEGPTNRCRLRFASMRVVELRGYAALFGERASEAMLQLERQDTGARGTAGNEWGTGFIGFYIRGGIGRARDDVCTRGYVYTRKMAEDTERLMRGRDWVAEVCQILRKTSQ